ncbi:hypothetical protein POM88_052876 [Heracleum sosnowskyi]|uniref:Uncharacterized protein n=1 Tax=Heracleum sosnowskyi TaxID=360622 RepID=A0AAD8GS23_9APIA|nr:hypothetical protein POM88_052876 [Heracleum sosnowskyi]
MVPFSSQKNREGCDRYVENRKATKEETARVNQNIVEEANKKKTDELVALRNDVDQLTTMITGIDKNVALMSNDIKNISKNVMIQATASFANHQDLVKKGESSATILVC